MILINLLPWRQQQRQQKKIQFFYILGLSLFFTLSISISIKVYLLRQVKAQSLVNQYLQTQNAVLDTKIKKVQELKQQRLALLERMRLIHSLYIQRASIVYLFEQLVRIVPKGVYFLQVQRIDNTIILIGKTKSNAKISELMRNIVASVWLAHPVLTEIKADEFHEIIRGNFQVKMQQLHTPKFYDETT